MERIDLRHENGQTLIYVALGMVVLLGFVALAIDVGYVYGERRRMQNAADAGALAGAHDLCLGLGDAAARATSPGLCAAKWRPVRGAFGGLEQLYRDCSGQRDSSVSALRLCIGMSTMDVPASAAAQCGQTCSGTDCGLWRLDLASGTVCTITRMAVEGPSTFGMGTTPTRIRTVMNANAT